MAHLSKYLLLLLLRSLREDQTRETLSIEDVLRTVSMMRDVETHIGTGVSRVPLPCANNMRTGMAT